MHGSSSLLHLDGQTLPKRTPIQLTLRYGLHLRCLHLQQESLVAAVKLGPEHAPSDPMSVRVQPLYETRVIRLKNRDKVRVGVGSSGCVTRAEYVGELTRMRGAQARGNSERRQNVVSGR